MEESQIPDAVRVIHGTVVSRTVSILFSATQNVRTLVAFSRRKSFIILLPVSRRIDPPAVRKVACRLRANFPKYKSSCHFGPNCLILKCAYMT